MGGDPSHDGFRGEEANSFTIVTYQFTYKVKWVCIYYKTAVSHVHWTHRLIKITDRTLDVIFSRFGWNASKITLRQKPRGVSRSRRRTGSLCLVIQRRLSETHQAFCLRVIANKFHPNLEKRTPISVLSVVLINLWLNN